MPDSQLTKLLIALTDATRDLPDGHATNNVRDRVIDVIRHLESQKLIAQTNWHLGPR
jgi:hypothetical protein